MILETELYEHQRAAAEKLLPLRIGALYMEMGTGKTRTALEIIKKRADAGKLKRVLWLCPCSVKKNLRDDIVYHCGDFPPFIEICGIETLSSSVRENVRLLEFVSCGDAMLIVDESNLVKNPRALRTENITRIAEKCKYRMILNGTPVTRDMTDLFSQWYLLDWRVLGYRSFYSFAANHIIYDSKIPGKISQIQNIDYLTRRIAPYTYQVKKDECLSLPQKHYYTYYVEMDPKQAEEYYDTACYMIAMIDERRPDTIYRMFSALQLIISGRHVYGLDKHITSSPMYDDPKENPRILKLLSVVRNTEGKVLIFAKYTQEIKDIVRCLSEEYGEGSAVEFTGELTQKKRQENVRLFKNDARFLVANKTCAGYGLNLQFCHNVIFYSNDFDFGTRQQAEDRVHRIGQAEEVEIYDIVCEKTIDEQIQRCLSRKENLLHGFKQEIKEVQNNKQELMKWVIGGLKSGDKVV